MKLFGSSGIRGVANKDITVDLALKVGMALGKIKKTAVIGRDPRIAGQMIEHAVIAGLVSSGCNVVRVGLVTTPTLAYATRDYDCGVMITASHNPAQDIGIKLWNPDGMAFDSRQQENIESIIRDGDFVHVKWNEVGTITSYYNAVRDHMDMILSNVGNSSMRVVLDCGCGAGGTITPFLLREMGCEVITLNSQLDGHFPARNSEPNEKNLWMLMKVVKELDARLGIAHDGDADRMMAVDEKGNFVSGDELLTIFASFECKGRSKIAVPVDTSMIVDDALPDAEITRTRVGDVYVAEEIKRQGANFGGEPSGSWIFPKLSYCPDGIYAAARLVDIVKKTPLSKLTGSLPQYPTLRGTLECDDSSKQKLMEAIKQKLEPMGNVSNIDGIRVEMDGGWVLVRASGTEPKIRITAQAKENLEELYETTECLVKECLR
ncbi:phosphoglucosamine mutase [Methanolobus halotolerans]|uniref:Phosphoglucosamine mutase n=1 Tax=Methanolobus halotolerans TaxID=2052935 RepID=A0A4E0PYH1_9EURY|nr:phosphoglucosamine mutase [Methanolobus halotolerans]TGC10579.1 phosphoglucosamine mutase [Methanolobus halotolerans]